MPDGRPELDELFSLAYEELHRLARSVRSEADGETLGPTALVHEAWIRMSASPELAALPRAHFKAVAARAMRQVLVDAARRRTAAKRGGRKIAVTLDEESLGDLSPVHDLLALDEALHELARVSPRQASLVEARFFAGLEVAEAAEALSVSETTAHRDWRAARAWLSSRLEGGAG